MARKEVIQIRCSALEKDKWRETATSQQLELSAWIRQTLDRAATLHQARVALDEER